MDHRYDEHTTIRTRPSPTGRYWTARCVHHLPDGTLYEDPREMITSSHAISSETEAHHMAARRLAARAALQSQMQALTDAGTYADLTTHESGPYLDREMGALTGRTSPAASGECHHCGLRVRDCDCR